MARSLDNYDVSNLARPERLLDPRRLDRSAARAIAAAISSLLITTLVVSSSVSALEPEGTIAGNSFGAGTITLVDDDRGRSLVNLSDRLRLSRLAIRTRSRSTTMMLSCMSSKI